MPRHSYRRRPLRTSVLPPVDVPRPNAGLAAVSWVVFFVLAVADCPQRVPLRALLPSAPPPLQVTTSSSRFPSALPLPSPLSPSPPLSLPRQGRNACALRPATPIVSLPDPIPGAFLRCGGGLQDLVVRLQRRSNPLLEGPGGEGVRGVSAGADVVGVPLGELPGSLCGVQNLHKQ